MLTHLHEIGDFSEALYLCTVASLLNGFMLARDAVKPQTEMFVRSFGNDQDLFNFIWLGTYQDARPEKRARRLARS